jgi:hypothetical protein
LQQQRGCYEHFAFAKVPLRELWKHEAHGFAHWLADNLDLLGEKIGFTLTFVKREASAGPFSADILGRSSLTSAIWMRKQPSGSPASLDQSMKKLSTG